MRIKITVLLLFTFLAVMKIPSQELIPAGYSLKHPEYRDSIAGTHPFEDILNNPEKIDSRIVLMDGEDDNYIECLFDFHAVYNIPIQKLLFPLLDLANEKNVFSRMIESEVLFPERSLWEPNLEKIHLSYKMGNIGDDYRYILFKNPELREDGSFLTKWYIYESLDGKMEISYGSWYLKEIILKQKKYTYIRNYVHYRIRNYSPGTYMITKLLGEKDVVRFFRELSDFAR